MYMLLQRMLAGTMEYLCAPQMHAGRPKDSDAAPNGDHAGTVLCNTCEMLKTEAKICEAVAYNIDMSVTVVVYMKSGRETSF